MLNKLMRKLHAVFQLTCVLPFHFQCAHYSAVIFFIYYKWVKFLSVNFLIFNDGVDNFDGNIKITTWENVIQSLHWIQ